MADNGGEVCLEIKKAWDIIMKSIMVWWQYKKTGCLTIQIKFKDGMIDKETFFIESQETVDVSQQPANQSQES